MLFVAKGADDLTGIVEAYDGVDFLGGDLTSCKEKPAHMLYAAA